MNPKKSIIKNNYDKRQLNNAQKTAIFLRRVEYSKNMRKNYNKKIIEQEILENIILIQKWWKTLYLIIMLQKNIRGFLSRSKLIDNLEKQESFINMLLYIHTLHKKIMFKRFYTKMIINDKKIKFENLVNKIYRFLIFRFYIKRWKKIIIYSNYIKNWKFTIDKFNILKNIIKEKRKEIKKIDNVKYKILETKFKNNSIILEKQNMNKKDDKRKNDELEHEKDTPRTKRTLVLCFKKKHQVLNNTVDNLEEPEILSEEKNFINENYEMMLFKNKKSSVKNLIPNSLKQKLENEKLNMKIDKNDITSSKIYDNKNKCDNDKFCKTEVVFKRKNRIKKQLNENDKFNYDNKNNINNRMIEDKNKKFNNNKNNRENNGNIKNKNIKNNLNISPNKKIKKIVKSLSNKVQKEEINTKDKEENKIKEFLINFDKKKHNKRQHKELNNTTENINEEEKKIISQRNLSIDFKKERINYNKLNENKENKREKSSLPTLVKKNNILQTTIQFQKPTQNILELKEKDKNNNLGKDNNELNLHEEIDYISKYKPPNKIKEIVIENLNLNKEILKEKEQQNLIELNNKNLNQTQIINSNNNLFNEKFIKFTQNPNNEVLGYPIPIDYQTLNFCPKNNYIENNNQINNQNLIHKKNFSSSNLFQYKPHHLGMNFSKKIIPNNNNENLSFSNNNNINNNENKILLNCNSNDVLNLSTNNINLNYNQNGLNNKIYMKRINICPPKNLNKSYIQHQ